MILVGLIGEIEGHEEVSGDRADRLEHALIPNAPTPETLHELPAPFGVTIELGHESDRRKKGAGVDRSLAPISQRVRGTGAGECRGESPQRARTRNMIAFGGAW